MTFCNVMYAYVMYVRYARSLAAVGGNFYD